MIYLLYGEEEYLLAQKVREIKGKLPVDLAAMNFVELDGSRTSLSVLTGAALSIPFLGQSRVVVINDWLKSKNADVLDEQLDQMLSKVTQQTELVFVETSLDRRKKATKLVLKSAQAQEYTQMRPNEILHWAMRQTEKKGGQIAGAAANKLVALVGTYLRLVDQEIDKLIAFTDGRLIQIADVDTICSQLFKEDVYNMIDAWVGKQKGKAIEILHQNIKSGAHPLYLLMMIVRQFRLLIFMRDLLDRGPAKQEDLVNGLHVHPYAAKKTYSQAKKYKSEQLLGIYNNLACMDLGIKNGDIEAGLALDLLFAQ